MSAAFSIEKPTVVATLPRPIDYSTGRYVVSEVHGGTVGSRKRKRSELVVGIDGEGLNIYNTRSSKLITSYALPPQSSFTCPPCSVRLNIAGNRGIERRTYVSTKGMVSKLMLFRDSKAPDGTTSSILEEKIFQGHNETITNLFTIPARYTSGWDDLLLIQKNGEIQCLDGTNLKTRWISPASTISKNTSMPDIVDHEVRFVRLTDAYTARKRLLKEREDIFSVFSYDINADGFNPLILVIITSPKDVALASDQTLHVVALPLKTSTESTDTTRSVHALMSVTLPKSQPEMVGEVVYDLQVASGVLHELHHQCLTSIDLSGVQPKVQSRLYLEDTNSFLPISRTSVLTASKKSINIYNRTFQSIQASIRLQSNLQLNPKKRKIDNEGLSSSPSSCKIVAYSAKHGLVHAIASNDLLAFHIDSRQDVPGRRRDLGLLIDALGCGLPNGSNLANEQLKRIPSSSLGPYIPGSDASVETEWSEKFLELDRFVLEEDIATFERLMAEEIGISRKEEEQNGLGKKIKFKGVNGMSDTAKGLNGMSTKSTTGDMKQISSWMWPEHKEEYPNADPRLVRYALSRIFSWRISKSSDSVEKLEKPGDNRLIIAFYPSNVVHWLIETGNLNYANVTSALRHDGQIQITEKVPAGQIVDALVDVDPELRMLFLLISSTHLGAIELLQSIRLLMKSLELLEDIPRAENPPLTNGEALQSTNGDLEAVVELEQEKAATALSVAESYLGEHSGIRGQALSLALAKLYACPGPAVVSALRSMFTTSEIVSLIYLLRFELARGAWTSRYLDTYEDGENDDEYGRENTILLLSKLLNCCIDAIGAGGWLSGDSLLVNGDHFESEELIQSLKLEVSAALEGIEEASYLKGLIGEMVRYGEGFQKGLPAGEKGMKTDSSKRRNTRPITLSQAGRESRLLPFGLKSEQRVSLYRVGAGGEIQPRTARDIGRLKSKKVGKYSRERIEI